MALLPQAMPSVTMVNRSWYPLVNAGANTAALAALNTGWEDDEPIKDRQYNFSWSVVIDAT